eukprot:UN19728
MYVDQFKLERNEKSISIKTFENSHCGNFVISH